RKQGAILLGNGGDNSAGSQGTFYEGAMTAANTFPTDATDQLIQANVVEAKYAVARVSVSAGRPEPVSLDLVNGGLTAPESKDAGLQTFSPGSSQDMTVRFRNSTGAAVTGVELSLGVPARWK